MNHKIIGLFKLQVTLEVHLVQSSAMNKDIYSLTRLLTDPSSLTLNIFRNRSSTISLGNLFRCLTTHTVFCWGLSSDRMWAPCSVLAAFQQIWEPFSGTIYCPTASLLCCFKPYRWAGFLPRKFPRNLWRPYKTSLPTTGSLPLHSTDKNEPGEYF